MFNSRLREISKQARFEQVGGHIMNSTIPPSPAAPLRNWRSFRILLAATLILTTIQGGIGGPLAGSGGYVIASSTSIGAVMSAIVTSSGLLIYQAIEGLAIFILAIAVVVLAFRNQSCNVKIYSILSFIAALIALLGGYLHIGEIPLEFLS